MRWGLGKPLHQIDMPEDEIMHHYFLDLWMDMWFYTFSVGLSKFVILGFYWRTFGFSIIRQPIRILFVCSVVWIIVRVKRHIRHSQLRKNIMLTYLHRSHSSPHSANQSRNSGSKTCRANAH
jgi:hypothetical protein